MPAAPAPSSAVAIRGRLVDTLRRDLIGPGRIGDVLAQFREHRADTLLTQSSRCRERIPEPLARHEPRNRFLHKGQVRPMLTQPWALGTGQQYASHQAHSVRSGRAYRAIQQ